MSPSTPPSPPAIHRPAPEQSQQKNAENYAQKPSTVKKLKELPYFRRTPGRNGHPFIIQAKHKHTNRLRSRKQAKMRAKRKAK